MTCEQVLHSIERNKLYSKSSGGYARENITQVIRTVTITKFDDNVSEIICNAIILKVHVILYILKME